jgi:hypothetical protein
MAARIVGWRQERRNTLRGFATIEFPSGLILAEIAVHQSARSCWAQPPSRPWVKDGALVPGERPGKFKWQPLISFATPEIRDAWSHQVIAAVRSAHPDALDPETSDLLPE